MDEWCELLSSFTKYLLESSHQVRVIRHHFRVSAVCRNLSVVGPAGQYRVLSHPAKERRNIVEPKVRVTLSGGEQLRRFDALDRMVNAAVHDEPVHKQKRSERTIPGARRMASGFHRSPVPDFIGGGHFLLSA
jgi:hypothetical protein